MRLRRWQTSRRTGAISAPIGRRLARRPVARDLASRGPRLQFEALEPRLAMAGVVINEFLALNTDGLQDEDEQRSDWIELKNTDPVPVSIGGWYLADSVDQWQIPSVTLAPNEYLVIFASGKDRKVVDQPLHTNFQLAAEGESLTLLMPDGITVIDAFNPYPAQVANVSYGRGSGGLISEPLVGMSEPVQVHVPTSGVLGTTWNQTGFVPDPSWQSGDTPIGFERAPGGAIDYRQYFELDVNSLMPAAQARDTIYMRIPFSVAEIGELETLTLGMQYDDGFVAYLNGHKIAERFA
ncbi:MAG TPA: lamin tail domain-containing protein, partial [Lacipirellulaceae bacterium]|nr:lamin tail domain-containing protein [Lacipirellulaceae bacterium]